MRYRVELISLDEKDELVERHSSKVLYEVKADIYGVCIKLLTTEKWVAEKWSENFYHFNEKNIRSHGRLYVLRDESMDRNLVLYNSYSNTAFLFNFTYYGWIKSIALSVAGDILEDDHGIYSVHGACLDIDGKGVAIVAPSGVGKTTHAYGLMRLPQTRVIADDFFYVRILQDLLAFSTEKSFYVRADLASIWPEYAEIMKHAEVDSEGRAVVDIRWAVGKGRVIPQTTLKSTLILKRDPEDPREVYTPKVGEALEYLKEHSYCNPHWLVRDQRKERIRERFYRTLLEKTRTIVVNTMTPPKRTHENIRRALGLK
ncbi:MAG: aldolase [Thermoproteota archaeon]|nr:MAG: aldolase [Candidatus Korarchaeota archaeon]